MVPKGRKLKRVPMIPKGRNLRWVPMGTQGYYPKKSTGMGWVGFVSEFYWYFRVEYPKRLVVLGIKPAGKILAILSITVL